MYPNIYDSGAIGNNPYGVYSSMQQQPQRKTVERVNGRNGAEMYAMAPDSSVLLLDTQDSIIWFIQTDSAGYKSIIPFDFQKHEDEPMPDIRSIDSRLDSFDERLKVIEEALK